MASPSSAALPTGDQLVQLAKKHLGEPYILGAKVAKDNANWKGPWDCAEFASWVVFQTTRALYGCDNDHTNPATADAYTGYWERDARQIGEIIPLDQAASTAGAMVLRTPAGGTGHIVISDGQGGTVEAHSHVDGVVALKLTNRRWDTGILVPGIHYTQSAAATVLPAPANVYRLTAPLMTGAIVTRIQNALGTAGFDPGSVDGVFGPHTSAAVVAFQLSKGLTADGEVGPTTAGALGISLS